MSTYNSKEACLIIRELFKLQRNACDPIEYKDLNQINKYCLYRYKKNGTVIRLAEKIENDPLFYISTFFLSGRVWHAGFKFQVFEKDLIAYNLNEFVCSAIDQLIFKDFPRF